MANLEELRNELAGKREQLQQKVLLTNELLGEVSQAGERQKLRDEIEIVEQAISERDQINAYHNSFRELVDDDEEDHQNHEPDKCVVEGATPPSTTTQASTTINGSSELYCAEIVHKAEFEWKLVDISWLQSAKEAAGQDMPLAASSYVSSRFFQVGSLDCDLVYSHQGKVGQMPCTLAFRVFPSWSTPKCINVRYRFFLKNADGEFKQWGDAGHEVQRSSGYSCCTLGPDVQSEDHARPGGIFGLSHKELLQSSWIQNDTLTVKLQLESREGQANPVNRKNFHVSRPQDSMGVDVPPPNLINNLASFLENGKFSDVNFVVQGERVMAHSLILSARSEVFEKELTIGMSESVSREIMIDDCDVSTFRLFLKFLYTDDFACIEEAQKSKDSQMSLQSLLATSHRYQVVRLQCWCEQKLCQSISVREVCGILRQAHLFGAKQLEQKCLTFIKDNMASVVALSSFATLARDWPEILLKLNLFTAGLPEASSSQALKAYEDCKKRPCPEEGPEPKKRAKA